ncbi:hypothetical protein, partial [Meiothermus taiwanensis]|uniref:hypothetical protein n=1 Tax=Meiothermus taiwanensis TaxID=172827 RepID=UPI001CBE1E95
LTARGIFQARVSFHDAGVDAVYEIPAALIQGRRAWGRVGAGRGWRRTNGSPTTRSRSRPSPGQGQKGRAA